MCTARIRAVPAMRRYGYAGDFLNESTQVLRTLLADDLDLQVMVIEILSLVTAMMCLLQFYQQTKKELEAHQSLLKFVAIKLVVFLFYVQNVGKSAANGFPGAFALQT